jgi:hypothetical protein
MGEPDGSDRERVAELLGREPRGAFEVVVRDATGDPVVVRNAPFLDDGTPMPTRYYLVGNELVKAVSRIESVGAVDEVEAELDDDLIADIHRRYESERDAAINDAHVGPRPSGGVGGTRIGVKCLHAHVAHQLAAGDDAIGEWTLDRVPVGTLGRPAMPHDAVPDADLEDQS